MTTELVKGNPKQYSEHYKCQQQYNIRRTKTSRVQDIGPQTRRNA
uniref:Uncharacterized protein n=1 Tax=Setaria italica TaxID=4555 RepID=K3ZG14_SETIT